MDSINSLKLPVISITNIIGFSFRTLHDVSGASYKEYQSDVVFESVFEIQFDNPILQNMRDNSA